MVGSTLAVFLTAHLLLLRQAVFYMQIKKGDDWIMVFNEELDMLLKDLTEEANNFKEAENPGEEKEALKDMLDIFMRGTQSVRERIDRYNERRWNR